MSSEHKDHTAREKLNAVLLVYEYGYSVAEICLAFGVSRQTWYNWAHQLKTAIQPLWGGLAKNKEVADR